MSTPHQPGRPDEPTGAESKPDPSGAKGAGAKGNGAPQGAGKPPQAPGAKPPQAPGAKPQQAPPAKQQQAPAAKPQQGPPATSAQAPTDAKKAAPAADRPPTNGSAVRPEAAAGPTESRSAENKADNPAPNAGQRPDTVRGSQQPPWQRGVQREPQTNIRPGSQPVTGASSTRKMPVVTGTAAPQNQAQGQNQTQPAPNREAAKAKAAGIDGPTRHISRSTLPTDMPDLSEAKHPTPAERAAEQRPATGAVAAPTRVAEADALRATVQLRRIDPWSTLKISSILSVSLFFVWMVAVGLLYLVLEGMGVWDRLNNAFTDIVADSGSGGLVTAGQVFGYSAVVGLANMVLFTALATIGAFIYNMCADLVGGLEVTLADRD
ncbi:DUF3566 domain-containing protein [Rhodococcus sp. HNM0569]|uniref:DUF3566 domain-containing protein n=1 Tax=Rhodococcus sp. HNM0569 TaxID=2716340 RepID=UPI00146F7A85|nr:hypothetical protein [Rhodococcus sp. HNM0569]